MIGAAAAASRSLSHGGKRSALSASRRGLATPGSHSGSGSLQHRVVVVGGGSAGQAISHQLLRSGLFPNQHDIAIVDPKTEHDYQPGWTLVGAGLKTKEELRRPMNSLCSGNGDGLQLYTDSVETFQPDQNTIKTRDGKTISYEHLVVVPGLGHYPERIEGLKDALQDKDLKIASIYDYNSCDTVWDHIQAHKSGPAIFTQPPQPHKCAGAPQKIMWLALDHWKSQGVREQIPITYATALPAMFAVPKYSAVLEGLRKEREVEGLFGHNLTGIEGSTAVFTQTSSGDKVKRPFSFLHYTPPQGPLSFIKNSPLADAASGFVSVDQKTLQHTKYSNVWSAGDSSNLPTSKTAAAITSEAPVLVSNLIRSVLGGKGDVTEYDGYTSCPLLTEYGKVLLAEFKYGGETKETFNKLLGLDQSKPSRAFYHLKKDFFPWVYYNSYVKGTWAGPKGFSSGLGSFGQQSQSRGFATSARSARDKQVRRPRDPLDTDASAVRHALSSGETLIVRKAPSSGSAYTVGNASSPHSIYSSDISSSTLPPALSRTSKRSGQRTDLSSSEISAIQSARSNNPVVNTPSKLARQYNCSELFIRIVAPAPTEYKNEVKGRKRVEEGIERVGFQTVLNRQVRKERRKMW
ncbi:unnamed protein product [Sympodiomycopsis kandeliae]